MPAIKTTATLTQESNSINLNGEAPKSTEQEKLKLPCAIDVFFPYCSLAWSYAKQHRLRLAARRPLYTEEYINGQELYVKVVKELPTLQARKNAASLANIQLQADNQAVRSLLQYLKSYIQFAYPDKVIMEAQFKAAGLKDYTDNPNNWPNTDSMIRNAKQFLSNNATKLAEGSNMPAGFPAEFTAVSDQFYTAWSDFIAKEKAKTDGTATQEDGLEILLNALNLMLNLGQRVFEFEPVERKKFVRKYLLNEVRSRHHAAIQGTVKLSTTGKPMAGVRVEIEGVEDAFAITNEKGRYSINIVGGDTYNVRFIAQGTEPLTLSKAVKPGVKGELKANLMPVSETTEMVPPMPDFTKVSSTSDSLKTAMEEVKKVKGNGMVAAEKE